MEKNLEKLKKLTEKKEKTKKVTEKRRELLCSDYMRVRWPK